MFAKIAALILLCGFIACLLLGIRQSRIQTANEIVRIQQRIIEHDRTLWRLRVEVAQRISPVGIGVLTSAFGELSPIREDQLDVALAFWREQAAIQTALRIAPEVSGHEGDE